MFADALKTALYYCTHRRIPIVKRVAHSGSFSDCSYERLQESYLLNGEEPIHVGTVRPRRL